MILDIFSGQKLDIGYSTSIGVRVMEAR